MLTVALIGPDGAGKTTVARRLERYADDVAPEAGHPLGQRLRCLLLSRLYPKPDLVLYLVHPSRCCLPARVKGRRSRPLEEVSHHVAEEIARFSDERVSSRPAVDSAR